MTKIRIIVFFIYCFSCFSLSAKIRMRDVFATMPDSLLTLVTTNNRLDCIDFIENNMQAKVKNKAGDFVEMKKLTDNYLLFETSEVSCVEMKLFSSSDSTAVICVVETVKGPASDSYIHFYDQSWQPVFTYNSKVVRPTVESFFPNIPDEKRKDIDDAINELRDMTLMEARLSASDNTLTWTLSVSELSKEIKKAAQECVQPVVVSIDL